MAAGAFSDEFVLRSTEPTQKEKKKMNNLAVPGHRTYAQGSNRPFGLSPFALINVTVKLAVTCKLNRVLLMLCIIPDQLLASPWLCSAQK